MRFLGLLTPIFIPFFVFVWTDTQGADVPITGPYLLHIEQVDDRGALSTLPRGSPLRDKELFFKRLNPWISTCNKPFWYDQAPSQDSLTYLSKRTVAEIAFEGLRRLYLINPALAKAQLRRASFRPLVVSCGKLHYPGEGTRGLGRGWLYPGQIKIGMVLPSVYEFNLWNEPDPDTKHAIWYRQNAFNTIFHEFLHFTGADNDPLHHSFNNAVHDVIYSCSDTVFPVSIHEKYNHWREECISCASAKQEIFLSKIDLSNTAALNATASCLRLEPVFSDLNPDAHLP